MKVCWFSFISIFFLLRSLFRQFLGCAVDHYFLNHILRFRRVNGEKKQREKTLSCGQGEEEEGKNSSSSIQYRDIACLRSFAMCILLHDQTHSHSLFNYLYKYAIDITTYGTLKVFATDTLLLAWNRCNHETIIMPTDHSSVNVGAMIAVSIQRAEATAIAALSDPNGCTLYLNGSMNF